MPRASRATSDKPVPSDAVSETGASLGPWSDADGPLKRNDLAVDIKTGAGSASVSSPVVSLPLDLVVGDLHAIADNAKPPTRATQCVRMAM
jgi:hypothetical protein